MKYELGETVVIKKTTDIHKTDFDSYFWSSSMDDHCGKSSIITERSYREDNPTYKLKDLNFIWDESWIQPLPKNNLPEELFEI